MTSSQMAGKAQNFVVALAGNPNAGKTTLFNFLTGLNQKVTNYPGVTVEQKSGTWATQDFTATLVDLPGLYSLEATSVDESIARQVLLGTEGDSPRPTVVVAVVDATNLERNLYLVTQLFEFDIPVVIALTMVDLIEREGLSISVSKLSQILKVPIVEMNVREGKGTVELARAVSDVASRQTTFPEIGSAATESESVNSKIFARYSFISEAVQQTVKRSDSKYRHLSEKIDRVLTHKIFGPIILLALLLLIFQTIFTWASVPMDLLEQAVGAVGSAVRVQMPEGILPDLIVDGIIAGVGGVLVFLPQILLLFLFISILEDTGYMARAAFMLDKLMSGVGLNGKAFLPLMSSFACAIPGVMATRTIEDRRDRLATIMIAPLMSCSARLPVYTLMISAFFAGQTVLGFLSLGSVLMLAMYLLGILIAVLVAFILKRSVLKGAPAPFLMELPPYRLPNFRTVFMNMVTRAWLFVKRAGTVIMFISIILWALMYFPRENSDSAAKTAGHDQSQTVQSTQLQNSYAGRLGRFVEPVIQPLGFDWKIGVALIASFAAREVMVSTLGIIYNVGNETEEDNKGLIDAIRTAKSDDGKLTWTPLTAITLMVFFVLAMQCMSTVAVVRRETNSWGWTFFMIGYMTILAYGAAFITYNGGRFLGYE